ncbi:MAG TPA: hypothetical protein VIU12_02050 [Chryseolinea sp.]
MALPDKLKSFFETNRPPKNIYAIVGDYVDSDIRRAFFSSEEVKQAIPNYLLISDKIILTFNQRGDLFYENMIEYNHAESLFNCGFIDIFKEREGLITAASDNYHFVFPSGKHSPFFLRTGNLLLNSSEIYFMVVPLLRYIEKQIVHIYCDTSSINSLAFALIELRKRFDYTYQTPNVISFGSYDHFENFNFKDLKHSLIFISASTSGNLVKKLQEKNPTLRPDGIISILYLSDTPTESLVLYNLSSIDHNTIDRIDTSKMSDNEIDCKLCRVGSFPVRISGDMFLVDKPKVNAIQIKKTDRPSWLNRFMKIYHSKKETKISLIRCFYGEERFRRFEIYFRSIDVFNNLFIDESFKDDPLPKLKQVTNQIIPAALKQIVYLNDPGSKELAHKIEAITEGVRVRSSTELLENEPESEEFGAILIVCSTLVTGNNILYVNKYLRRYKNMSKTFLTFFARTESEVAFDFIKSNICAGSFGPNTNQLVQIEKIECPLLIENPVETERLTWSLEINLLRNLLQNIDEETRFEGAKSYVQERLRILEDATDLSKNGLTDEVFLRNPLNSSQLKINPSFAFLDFDSYHDNATQADIYFVIAVVLNNLRHFPNKERKIIQEEHIRTLLDPRNFDRFNDGIIQAAILRCAHPAELNYKLDQNHSNTMMKIILKMVDNYQDGITSEGLIEFLFALCIRRVKLYDIHLEQITNQIKTEVTNPVLLLFNFYLAEKIYKKKP